MNEVEILTLQLISGNAKLPAIRNLIYATPEIVVRDLDGLFKLYQQQVEVSIQLAAMEKAYIQASTIVEQAHSLGIQILIPSNPYFSARLKEIKDPPLLLFIKGSMEALQGPLVAVVGTRQPSAYGSQVAYKISKVLAQQNIVVVSGLAEGIDSQAHQGCLSIKGKTVAVLAHGLDMIYPAKNYHIAEEIVATGGCLISESPPQTKPQKYTFVVRNRLQSGLSLGTIIVESQKDGGTMHTANFCLEQHRMLACVDFTDRAPQPGGNALLLQNKGAFCLRDLNNLNVYLEKIHEHFPLRLRQQATQVEQLRSSKMETISD